MANSGSLLYYALPMVVACIFIFSSYHNSGDGMADYRILIEKLESAIFNGTRRVDPNDEMWLNVVREKFLISPSRQPYNWSSIGKRQGDKSSGDELYEALTLILVRNETNKSSNPTKFFVEYPANDGEMLSNSLPFEQTFGWIGLLIEADPESQKQLYQKHRKAWISNSCLSETQFANTVTMMRYRNWTKLNTFPDHSITYSSPEDVIPLKAKCIPIVSLLSALHVTTVDYFSLNIEGPELDIIKTIPFEKIYVKVFSFKVQPEKKEDLHSLMTHNDYYLYTTVQGNFVTDAVYVNKRYAEELRSPESLHQ